MSVLPPRPSRYRRRSRPCNHRSPAALLALRPEPVSQRSRTTLSDYCPSPPLHHTESLRTKRSYHLSGMSVVFLFLFLLCASFPFIYLRPFTLTTLIVCLETFGQRNFLFLLVFSRWQQASSHRRSLHFLRLELPGLCFSVSEDEPVVVCQNVLACRGEWPVMGGALTDNI